MNTDILTTIVEACVLPLFGILTAYLVAFIKVKKEELIEKIDNDLADKYINMLGDTIADCVVATNQTYVDNLKKENMFTAEAQKEAFSRTYRAVLNILTEDAREYLTAIYGDLNAVITSKIEAAVSANK